MIKTVNEECFLITLSEHIDLSLTAKIASLVEKIEVTFPLDALLDITPSYTTVLVQLNLLHITPLVAEQLLISICAGLDNVVPLKGELIELPVYYDNSVGWDLHKVASDSGLTVAQVVECHCAKTYQVCAVGFSPGFAFLAELDEKITQPRHASPRKSVPAGSVAIADTQTAVYPSDSPGGWHIIGNCPTKLFDIHNDPISPFKIGDRVQFKAISYQQFIKLGGKVINENE